FERDQAEASGGVLRRTPAGARLPVVLPTRVAWDGNVQVEAWFPAGAWEKAPVLGLVLQEGRPASGANARARRPGSYSFLLRPGPGGRRAQLVRNGAVLREAEVKAAPGPLRLRARREGERLVLQVNDQAPLEFDDPFPLRPSGAGAVAVCWPAGVSLSRLRASRQAQPLQPSPLGGGGEAFGRGPWGGGPGPDPRHAR